MRLLVILVLAACSHKSAPTSEWCKTYVDELRVRGARSVEQMTKTENFRRHGSEELLAMVGFDPAIDVAFNACSDAAGDSLARAETRKLRVNDLQAQIARFVLRDTALDAAQAKQLGLLVEQLATAHSEP